MEGRTGCTLFSLKGFDDLQELILHHLDAKARQEATRVCRPFYESICRLEKNKRLKLDAKIKDDRIFESMLRSSRRFETIRVDAGYDCDEATALRIGAVLAKFKSYMKKLAVLRFPLCSQAISTPIMDAMMDVEELSLSLYWSAEISPEGCFDQQRDFTKLKRLELAFGRADSLGILNKIPDSFLEALTIKDWDAPTNEARLQTFVNRQKMIRKLEVSSTMRGLDLSHLDLEELKLKMADEIAMAAMLKRQPNLRVLSCGLIGGASFNELQKMRKLEVLHASFTGQMRGELANLKELKIFGGSAILQQVAFPKLTTFGVVEEGLDDEGLEFVVVPNSLGPENVVALRRSATYLQHISIENQRIDVLPAILENFPQLQTLRVEPLADGALIFEPPSRPNLGLKQLIIRRQVFMHQTPDSAIHQTITLCPNLERIMLGDIVFSKHQILSCILSHPRLTHFSFGSENGEQRIFDEHGNSQTGLLSRFLQKLFKKNDFLDPQLMAIINVFRNSPNFISLHFWAIADWGEQRIEDVLEDDADQIEVYKVCDDSQCCLSLTKKVHDPFENFDYDFKFYDSFNPYKDI